MALVAAAAAGGGTALYYESQVVAPQKELTAMVDELQSSRVSDLETQLDDYNEALTRCMGLIEDAAKAHNSLDNAYQNARDNVDSFFTSGSYLAGDVDYLYFYLYGYDGIVSDANLAQDSVIDRLDECNPYN